VRTPTFLKRDAPQRRIGRRPILGLGTRARHLRASSQDGFLLIEVMISALLVALIVVATMNGFDTATQVTADQRFHSEASLLAAESQEQLRSDPATALDALESAAHTYTRTVGSTTYTITQEAKPLKASGSSTGCNATETSSENGANIDVVSSVTWPQLTKLKRPPVKQASIITPPEGSSLEVNVTNGGSPALAVSGVTATARFEPVGSGSQASAEGTTGANGCITMTGLATTSATVEIAEKPYFITTGGTLKYPTKEVSIAPNITTQYAVTYAEGGRITAEFTYKGATTYESKPVTGDTFVVENSKIPAGDSTFAVGSTGYEYEAGNEQNYQALTGKYASTATTATASKYVLGDLFPFPQAWSAYAGDCPKNNVGAEATLSEGAKVTPGNNTTIKVPLSYVLLNVYSGTQSSKGSLVSTSYPVTITDTSCEGYAAPLHAIAGTYTHAQTTSTAGHLEHPFQPFGKATLCVYNASAGRTDKVSYENTTSTGSTKNVYIGEASRTEAEATRKATETSEHVKWEKEEKEKGKPTKAERLTKEAALKTANTEATTKEREAEEKGTKEVAVASGQTSC
jgi:Tfp pilus assembly protein PilV